MPGGDGIRGSKDLRAEIGKFPNSTNERKQMSNKTIFKRIALVAVAALGAGVLSVAPANAANNPAVGSSTNAASAAGVLNIVTLASITGDAGLNATITSGNTGNFSVGLLSNSVTQDTASLSSTATMRSDGEIVFYWTGTAVKKACTIEVTGGTITDSVVDGGTNDVKNLNASKTQLVGNGDDAAPKCVFAVTPNSGATSMTVSVYESAAQTAGNAAEIAAIQAGTTSRGALAQRYTVTVATTSVSGAYSATYSYVVGQASNALAAPTTNSETSSSILAPVNSTTSLAYISIDLKDAYDVSLDGLGALVVSATGGAGVAWNDSYAAATPTNTTAVTTNTSGTITVARPTAAANKNFATTVTITWNGITVGTKTINFRGEIAKLTANVDYIGAAGTSTPASNIGVIATDGGGNTVYVSSGIIVDPLTLNTKVTAVANDDWSDSSTADTKSDFAATCAGTTTSGKDAGSADIRFSYTNPFSGTVIYSNVITVTCAGNAVTYTASLDKAVYAPGDVATLTITGKDLQGKLANAVTAFQGSSSSVLASLTGGQLTLVGAALATGVDEKFSSGAGTYVRKFTVGSTEGAYNMVVSIPVINAYGLGGTDQVVPYSVKSGTTSVSNADVLKSIVALIASINKQIQALQKLILKR